MSSNGGAPYRSDEPTSFELQPPQPNPSAHAPAPHPDNPYATPPQAAPQQAAPAHQGAPAHHPAAPA
ncbi:serine/threonine protein kinase, partial [Streptomyces sp. Lzd4kr]|nr:serine/threonine protein kinase [Streptomyces sp. Lzd4kr]